LAAMMYGGNGMFSSPVTVILNMCRTSHRTTRRISL
jgi:hypothetical protein